MQKHKKHLFMFFLFLAIYSLSARTMLFKQSGTPYYIYLAESFLHGHVELLHLPPTTYDLILFQNKWYVPGGITPALLMIPFVLFQGLGASDIFVGILLGTSNVLLMYKLLGNLPSTQSRRKKTWLTILFAIGTVHWWVASFGQVWFIAQTTAVTFTILFVNETICNNRPWLAGLWLGLAMLSRPTTIFASLFYLTYIFLQEKNWRNKANKIISFSLAFSFFIVVLLAYNALRFGGILDFGYSYVQGDTTLTSIYRQFGGFNIRYIPCNIYISAFGLPLFSEKLLELSKYFCWHLAPILSRYSKAGMSAINPLGLSIFFTTPAFLIIFQKKEHSTLTYASLVGVISVALPILQYHNTGFFQFGYRYILDLIVFLFILLANSKTELRLFEKSLILISIAINFMGTLIMFAYLYH